MEKTTGGVCDTRGGWALKKQNSGQVRALHHAPNVPEGTVADMQVVGAHGLPNLVCKYERSIIG